MSYFLERTAEVETMDMDFAALEALAAKSPLAKVVFKALATRERDRSVTDLKRLRLELNHMGNNLTSDDIIRVFEVLQRAGAGKLIRADGRSNDKFQWNFSSRNVAKIATGQATEHRSFRQARGPLHVASSSAEPQVIRAQPRLQRSTGLNTQAALTILNDPELSDSKKIALLRVYFED